jgi:hypothetical protein
MSDIKNFLDIVEQYSEEDALVESQDSFDIELGEDLLIETGVVDITEDGIVVEGDEETLRLLAEHGVILEETDWSKYDEPTVSRIAKGVTKPVDRTDYNVPPAMRDPDQGKPGFEKRKSRIMKGVSEAWGDSDIPGLSKPLANFMSRMYHHRKINLPNFSGDPRDHYSTNYRKEFPQNMQGQIQHSDDEQLIALAKKFAADTNQEYTDILAKMVVAREELKYGLLHIQDKHDKKGLEKVGEGSADEPVDPDMDADDKRFDDIEESGLQAYLGKKKYGEEGMKALQKAGREGASKEKMAQIRAKHDKLDEEEMDEAKYQGREVPLGKPMAGDVKKSKVYVRKPNGKVVKVNFGDKKMRIKKSNPARRKSFRARHNCKNPGPRWKARYWSCRAW